MAEYKPQRLADELVQSLGSSIPAAEVEAFLAKASRASVVAPKEDCLASLQKQCPDPKAFTAKYLEIKEKNYESLGPCVELLARISEDPKMKKFLRKVSGPSAMVNGEKKHSSASAAVTTESLQLVKNKIKAAGSELEHSQQDHKLDHSIQQDSFVRHNGVLYQCPAFPDWFSSRPNLSRDFVTMGSPESRLLPLVNVCLASQESALLMDMINCLVGVDGKHVVAQALPDPYATRTFQFAEGTDPALEAMCSKILSLATQYSLVVRFVEQKYEFKYGRVNNALAAAIDEHLNEYLTFVTQTESQLRQGDLRLQKLLYSIKPMLHIMSVLSHIAQSINNADARGGKVLSLLHQYVVRLAGDQDGQQVCLDLTQAASKPYFNSLDTWLLCGVIEDPFNEFLVEDNQVDVEGDLTSTCNLEDCDGYWMKRYSVRRDRVPIFLASLADKILSTGKYLNVIRQCGKNVRSPQRERTEYTIKGRECERAIEKAYQFASKTLLEILLTEYDLIARLRWMKHFFLLEQGDFISQFMDACEKELSKPVSKVEPSRLESLLGLVLRTSSAATAMGGCYLEDLHTHLFTCSLSNQMKHILAIQGKNVNSNWSSGRGSAGSEELDKPVVIAPLTGIEGFSFQVDIQWPVSIILSSQTLLNYQILFRHLFYIKHFRNKNLIFIVWSSNKVARSFAKNDSPLYRPAFALRQRMLTCVQSLECYMTSEVIEPNWNVFMEKMKKVASVDEVLLFHSDFLDQCQKECMLNVGELLQPMTDLLESCTSFCAFILHMRKYFVEAELGSELTESIEPMEVLLFFFRCMHFLLAWVTIRGGELRGSVGAKGWESFETKVARHEQHFTSLLHNLLELVSSLGRDAANAKLLNVLYTLDFNGFYSCQLRKDGRAASVATPSTSG
ncbi:hypothetical protein B566_EDAN011435 [Ephemera danica]|nr:hypothetical protein B566_EDAN011435 [Ephemera danica]